MSIDDISILSKYGLKTESSIKQEIIKEEEVKRLQGKLDIAEAVHYAFAATQAKKNQSLFVTWQNKIIRRIQKLNGLKENPDTVWKKLKKLKKI